MKSQAQHQSISLPILIRCAKHEKEGDALSLHKPAGDSVLLRWPKVVPVRRFSDADFGRAQQLMGKGGTKRFVALRLLQTAIARKKFEDIKGAREKLCAAVAHDYELLKQMEDVASRYHLVREERRKPPDPSDNSMMAQLLRFYHPGDLSDEAKIVTERYRSEDAVSVLATETSAALDGVRVVLWRSGKRVLPALYCENLVVAAYTTALFGRRWKVCPYSACGKWFIVTKAQQDYCCPSHREAHRVARWRERQKAREKHEN